MCKYCTVEECPDNIMFREIDMLGEKAHLELYLSEAELRLCSTLTHTSTIMAKKIKYCPICGEKLKGSA